MAKAAGEKWRSMSDADKAGYEQLSTESKVTSIGGWASQLVFNGMYWRHSSNSNMLAPKLKLPKTSKRARWV